jgi:hypothetical protein
MKRLFIALLVLLTLVSVQGFSQQTQTADRVVARQSLYLRNWWLDSVKRDTSFFGAVRSIPTADAVGRYVKANAPSATVDSAQLANAVATSAVVTKTAADLRALTSVVSSQLFYLRDPKVGGLFSWDPADNTSPDDGLNTLVTASGARLKRLQEEFTHPSVQDLMNKGLYARKAPAYYTTGYYRAGDGGGATYRWVDTSTKAPDTAFVLAPTGYNLSTPGRWHLVVQNGTINFAQVGGKCTFTTGWNNPRDPQFDNHYTLEKALAFARGNRIVSTIYFPFLAPPLAEDPNAGLKSYFFSRPISLHQQIKLLGDQRGDLSYTAFTFYRTHGILSYGGNHSKGSADGSHLENLSIGTHNDIHQYLPDSAQHGIWIQNHTELKNLYVTGFMGDGVFIDANSAGVTAPDGEVVFTTNANNWRAYNVVVMNNGANGFHIRGGDVNVGTGIQINAVKNKHWGIKDASFLGATWINCQVSDDAVYGGYSFTGVDGVAYHARTVSPSVWVYSGSTVKKTFPSGATFYYRALQDNQNQSPVEGVSNAYWEITGAWKDGIQAYNPATSYVPNHITSYNGAYYKSKGWVTGVAPTGAANSATYWEATTHIGDNPLYDYTVWDAGTAYQKTQFYAARRDNQNQALPAVGSDNTYWSYIGERDTWGLSRKWNATDTFVSGGGYSTHNVNNSSVFMGCYAEAGLPHSAFTGFTVFLNGFHREVKMIGGSGLVSGGSGGLTMDNLFLNSPKGKVHFGYASNITADNGYGNGSMSFEKPMWIGAGTTTAGQEGIAFGNSNPPVAELSTQNGNLILGGWGSFNNTANTYRLDVVGKTRLRQEVVLPALGAEVSDTATYKPSVLDASGNLRRLNRWPAELGDGDKGDVTVSGSTWTVDKPVLSTLTYGATTTWNYATQGTEAKVTLTGNATLSLTNLPSGKVVYLTLEVIQDATGSRTLTLPAGTKVIGGALTLTTTGGATDLITLRWNGTTLFANYGKDYK